MNRDEVDASLVDYVARRKVRNRITLVLLVVWLQYWFGQWWVSLLVLVMAGFAAEWAWRPGGSSYERKRDDWLDDPSRFERERIQR